MKVKSYLPIFEGFYGTCFESDMAEDFFLEYYPHRDYDEINWDFDEYRNRIARSCTVEVQGYIQELFHLTDEEFSIKFLEIDSPRYYNFSNDSIIVEYNIDDKIFDDIFIIPEEESTAFDQYVEDNYTSSSGFISFISNDYKDWVRKLSEKDTTDNKFRHMVGSVLQFYLEVNEFDVPTLYNDIIEDLSIIYEKE